MKKSTILLYSQNPRSNDNQVFTNSYKSPHRGVNQRMAKIQKEESVQKQEKDAKISKINHRIKQLVFNDHYDVDSEAKLVEQVLTSKSMSKSKNERMLSGSFRQANGQQNPISGRILNL